MLKRFFRLLVIGSIITVLAMSVGVAFAMSGHVSREGQSQTLAKAEYEVAIVDPTPLVPDDIQVEVEVKAAPAGTYDVILIEGATQTTLGVLNVAATGKGERQFRLSMTSGTTHTVRLRVENAVGILFRTGNVTFTVP